MNKIKNVNFDIKNPTLYLYSDAMYLKSVENFNPNRQWIGICGSLIKEDDFRRYFGSLEIENDFLFVEIIPKNTCYKDFYIYNHNYIENKTIDIFWRDMSYSYSFNEIKGKDLEKQYFYTRGKIIKQNSTHILFEIEKHLMWAKDQENLHKEYKYISIPKSYIRSIKTGEDWCEAELVKLVPEIDQDILSGENSIIKIRQKNIDSSDNKNINIFYSFYSKKYKIGFLK